MRRIEKNRKGFTLAEEVVTVLLIGILVASASAILLNAMRIFCQNVIMFNAQSKGIAVMEQLEDRLNYAKEIGGSYGGISDISRKADCAHQVFLSVALKNSSVTVITAADSSHVYSNTGTSTYLYIGSLE